MAAADPGGATAFARSRGRAVQARWSDDRVARELERFLANRGGDDWPPYREFRDTGRKRLHAAIVARGGPERWAVELGVLYRPRPGRPAWDDRRIRRELRLALIQLAPLATWPTMVELADVSSWALIDAIKRTGGQGRWAGEFGIAIEPWRTRSPRRG